jgi:hypothetical protein
MLQRERICQIIAWATSLTVLVLSIAVWGDYYQWHIWPVNSYQLFPVFGLVAFGLMWAHYTSGALRQLMGLNKKVLSRYFTLTSWVVLVLICLHPGLLIYQRFRDGAGLPPHSYESYVAPGRGWVTLLGTTCLLVFLAFEFRRVFGQRSWWHYVADAGDAAMLGILYHGLRLGSQLMHGWFRFVWLFYFVTLVAVLIRKYVNRYRKSPPKLKSPA